MKTRWMVALMTLFAWGCTDRTHLSSAFGHANTRAFRAQVIDPSAGKVQKPDPGLDPEEAAEVVETYRKSISSKKGDSRPAAQPQILVLDPRTDKQGSSAETK